MEQADVQTMVQGYIRVYESLHIQEMIKLYNSGKNKQASIKEQQDRITYAQFQQILNSIDGKRRYRDRNYIVGKNNLIIGYRLCEFDDVMLVFNNEARKEVNQYGYKPPLNGTINEYATERGRQPTYKSYTDIFLNEQSL